MQTLRRAAAWLSLGLILLGLSPGAVLAQPPLNDFVGVQGLDSSTGLRCTVGTTATCQMPIALPSSGLLNSQTQVYVGGFWVNLGGVLEGGFNAAYVDENTSSQFHADMIAQIPNCAASPACTGSIGGVNLLAPATLATVGYTSSDPCAYLTKLHAHFSSTSSGGNLITGTSGKQTYVCSIRITVSTQTNFSLCEATSTACSGGTPAAVYGNTGTTASNGLLLGQSSTVGGGWIDNGGGTTIAQTATPVQNIDVLFTTTNAPTVVVDAAYVQQ